MASNWTKTGFGAQRVDPGNAPAQANAQARGGESYLGRIVIDVWQQTAQSDGITYQVQLADGAPDHDRADALTRDVVGRLHAQFKRSPR